MTLNNIQPTQLNQQLRIEIDSELQCHMQRCPLLRFSVNWTRMISSQTFEPDEQIYRNPFHIYVIISLRRRKCFEFTCPKTNL